MSYIVHLDLYEWPSGHEPRVFQPQKPSVASRHRKMWISVLLVVHQQACMPKSFITTTQPPICRYSFATPNTFRIISQCFMSCSFFEAVSTLQLLNKIDVFLLCSLGCSLLIDNFLPCVVLVFALEFILVVSQSFPQRPYDLTRYNTQRTGVTDLEVEAAGLGRR